MERGSEEMTPQHLAELLQIPVRHGWQTQLAAKLGVSQQLVSSWKAEGRVPQHVIDAAREVAQ